MPAPPTPPPEGWWEEAFPIRQTPSQKRGHPKGNDTMLILITYDITSPKRLKKAASCCLDFGVRVQLSVFECRLEADRFQELWERLTQLLDPDEDKLVAYPIAATEARKVRTYGQFMILSEQPIAYVF